jgi:hypothetical protein
MFGSKRRENGGGAFVFRVSDVVDVPLRGVMLRLRVVEGTPSLADLGPGAQLQLRSPGGEERRVQVVAHAITSGRQTQARLDRRRELDVVIAPEDATTAATPPGIGWLASGPVRASDGS